MKQNLNAYKPRNDEVILVIGASGYVGKSICSQLARRKRKWKVYGKCKTKKKGENMISKLFKLTFHTNI